MAYALLSPLLDQRDPCNESALALAVRQPTKMGSATVAPAVPASPTQIQNVAPFFGNRKDFHDDPDAPLLSWLGAFQLVRDVGAKVRNDLDCARTITQQSQSLIQGTIAQVKEAELRAEVAATTAAIAVLRADRAEVRARLAEKQAEQAEDWALAAEDSMKEAQLWLRHLHAKLKNKCNGSMIAPKRGPAV